MLIPICERLGIEVPELYLEMNVLPNAYTYGDTKPFIVLTSGLIECLPPELIPTVLAHECGHIACHHTLYRTMGQMILGGTAIVPGIGLLISLPLKAAFAYWMRCSEFSADRAAILCEGSSASIVDLCMRLSGYTTHIHGKASTEAFLKQAVEYREMMKDNMWNQSMEFLLFSGHSHPLTAIRAYEADQWGRSESVVKLISYLSEESKGEAHAQIPVPGSARSFLKQDADFVEEKLRSAGFTNIEMERQSEPDSSLIPNQITAFSIDGDSGFEDLAWFTPDAPVRITRYLPLTMEEQKVLHPDEVAVPKSSIQYLGQPWQTVCQQLVDAGFRNIVTVRTKATPPLFGREDGIKGITIDGRSDFQEGEWFAKDAPIRVTHYGA